MEVDEEVIKPSTIEGGKKRVEVKQWNSVAVWTWAEKVDKCSICENLIMDLCIKCQANQIPKARKKCTAVWGLCNHTFHTHCMSRWLETSKVCPLDKREWQFQKCGL